MKIFRLIYICVLVSSVSLAAELKSINAKEFIEQNPSIERKAIVEFITHQFDNKKISQTELDQIWNNKEIRETLELVRIQIIDQKIYADSYQVDNYYLPLLLSYLEKLVEKYKINNVDFILHALDHIHIDGTDIKKEFKNIPAFMMSKNLNSPYERDKFLLPDAFMLENYWHDLSQRIENTAQDIPWKNRANKIFWRGAPSGSLESEFYNSAGYNVDNIDKLPRLSLVILSKLYPEIIDARFTYPINSKSKSGKELKEVLDLLFYNDYSRTREEEHLNYKYLISLDGNTCSWVRIPWIMLSGSVLVKQETSKLQWFYPALKAYKNYVPVNEKLTDLFEQYNWMKNNDEEVYIIAQNANNFIKNNLIPEHIEAHMVITLNEYSKIQQGSHIIATLPPSSERHSIPNLLKILLRRLKVKMVNSWL